MGPPKLIRIGTSGWSYKDWEGVFYEPGESKLQKYCKVFDTVEIDSTFYSYPDPDVVEGLARNTPKDFVFAAKIPSVITHDKKLDPNKGTLKDLSRFLELLRPLKDSGKLGPLLIQLPPKFEYEKHAEVLERFLAELPGGYMFAVEFRDESWLRDDVMRMLSRHNVAYTIVDEPLLPPETHVTADFAYIRWHGRGRNPWYYYHYNREELEAWKPKIIEVSGRVKNVYGYFNNHFKGYAVHNALQVLEILGVITPAQRRVLEEVERNLRRGAVEQPKLSQILPPEKIPDSVEGMLKLLTNGARLRRAKEISGGEIEVLERTESTLSARVKEYRVFIDLERRMIIHDCADWARVKDMLSFCKHLAALMLRLEPEYSKRILREILLDKTSWTFADYLDSS
jgi:uncharacterized protein YecE (DUF72 family)